MSQTPLFTSGMKNGQRVVYINLEIAVPEEVIRDKIIKDSELSFSSAISIFRGASTKYLKNASESDALMFVRQVDENGKVSLAINCRHDEVWIGEDDETIEDPFRLTDG